MVADLWQRTGKISDCFKNSTAIVLQQCQNKVSFQGKGSSVESKLFVECFKSAFESLCYVRLRFAFFNYLVTGNCSEMEN